MALSGDPLLVLATRVREGGVPGGNSPLFYPYFGLPFDVFLGRRSHETKRFQYFDQFLLGPITS
jgi:hypothetical protein